MSINDINIDNQFRLRALRDDYIHAFVTYFLVEFTACPQRTVINTGMKNLISKNSIDLIFF